MPSREWPLRIQDILDAIARIQGVITGINFTEFESIEELILQGILYNFIIIGEASVNVNDEIKSRYPQIPWRLMGDMRNVMAHEYFQVNLDRLWRTISEDLPPLVPLLEELLAQEMRGD
ncbi:MULTISPECIES: DUF86 domain-containing protein [Kamptonema]|uniref:HepT-like ribonuclease domain-containing protein n=1 Tax=Kamptonema TaxID=1501433 RepID=UPI0001DAC84A|nr:MULTISPECIES: HepT-like ribonuclease domain-containing protein [Kamptonema]CBN56218.1 Genome sequencing data, contig C324 [Kamptonema sp. PCC 6506]